MDQLQRQTRFHALARLARPGAKQVPRSQAEVFGNQQPEAGHVVADLVGQTLPHAALDAERIAVDGPRHVMADLRHDAIGVSARAVLVEFFFAGRTRPTPVPRCGY